MPRRLLPLFCAGLLSTTTACRSEAPLPVVSSGADILLASDTELVRGLVPRQTTLDSLLRAQGLQSEVAGRVIAAAASVFDLRRLRANQPFVLERTPEGELRHFEYEIDQDRYLRVAVPQANDVRASVMPIQKEREDALAAGQISDATPSLFQAIESAGERPDLSIALAEIFAGEIDFNTELQPGDRFALAFEKFTREGRPATYGAIEAAEFQNDGRTLRAVRFTPPGGRPRTTTSTAARSGASSCGRRSSSSRASPRAFRCVASIPFSTSTARISASTTVRRPVRRWLRSPQGLSCRRPSMTATGAWCGYGTRAGTRPITCTCPRSGRASTRAPA